jgi:ribosomal protein L24E
MTGLACRYCDRDINHGDGPVTLDDDGRTFVFCSKGCRQSALAVEAQPDAADDAMTADDWGDLQRDDAPNPFGGRR